MYLKRNTVKCCLQFTNLKLKETRVLLIYTNDAFLSWRDEIKIGY